MGLRIKYQIFLYREGKWSYGSPRFFVNQNRNFIPLVHNGITCLYKRPELKIQKLQNGAK